MSQSVFKCYAVSDSLTLLTAAFHILCCETSRRPTNVIELTGMEYNSDNRQTTRNVDKVTRQPIEVYNKNFDHFKCSNQNFFGNKIFVI